MKRLSLLVPIVLAVSACSLSIDLADSTPSGEWQHSVPVSEGLEQVDATIRMDEGRLAVEGRTDELLSGDFVLDDPDLRPTIVFEGEGESGRLEVAQPGDADLDDDEYRLMLSDRVTFDLDVEMGAGESTLDLSGLQVTELTTGLGAGESTVVLPAGIASAQLQLGAGDTTVDAAALDSSAEVNVERGVGRTEVIVPAGITVEVDAAQGLGDIDADGFTQRGGELVREGTDDPGEVLSVRLRGGVGELVITVGA